MASVAHIIDSRREYFTLSISILSFLPNILFLLGPAWFVTRIRFLRLKGSSAWETYECISEVLSHLGRMFGMIFRVQWGQKSPKSGKMCLTKMYPGPCKGAAPDMLLLPASPLQAPCGTLARTRVHFGQTHFPTFW